MAAAEFALQRWEEGTLGKLNFIRSTTANRFSIINIGTGNLAALGGVSGPGNTLGLGGGIYDHAVNPHNISDGVAWMDSSETWDTIYFNGNPAGTVDYFTVAAQEVGHALGLGHTDNLGTADLMDGNYSSERTGVSSNDAIHIKTLYSPLDASGNLLVQGASGADNISLSISGSNLDITYVSTTSTYLSAEVTNISVDGKGGNDTISGSSRNEDLVGGVDNDVIAGGSGNDTLVGADGNDRLDGGLGQDTLSGLAGNDSMGGGPSGDLFAGGLGVDLADYSTNTAFTHVSLDNAAFDGQSSEFDNVQSDVENVITGTANDEIIGSSGNNVLTGGSGADTMQGGAGNDWLQGNAGNDSLIGNNGMDTLKGDAGADILRGIETTSSTPVADTLDGGADTDSGTWEVGVDNVISIP